MARKKISVDTYMMMQVTLLAPHELRTHLINDARQMVNYILKSNEIEVDLGDEEPPVKYTIDVPIRSSHELKKDQARCPDCGLFSFACVCGGPEND